MLACPRPAEKTSIDQHDFHAGACMLVCRCWQGTPVPEFCSINIFDLPHLSGGWLILWDFNKCVLSIWKKWFFCVHTKERPHKIVYLNLWEKREQQTNCCIYIFVYLVQYLHFICLFWVPSNEPKILQVWSLRSINLVFCDNLTDSVSCIGLSQPNSLLLILCNMKWVVVCWWPAWDAGH